MSSVEISALTLRIPTTVGRRRGFVHAATDVDLRLAAGHVHALIGESGCGKSVVSSALVGLLPPGTRIAGRVLIDDHDLTPVLNRPRDRAWDAIRGHRVGMVAQSAATAFTPTRTIGDQLDEVVAELGGAASAAELAAQAAFPQWALAAYPHELSGGMVARAALAAALAGQPDVLVADEPTSSLDGGLASVVFDRLRAQADAGAAVLLITHDLAALLDQPIADEISVMYAGRIVEHGPAAELLADPQDPYSQALLAALPRNGLHAVPGDPPALTDLDDQVRFEDRLTGVAR